MLEATKLQGLVFGRAEYTNSEFEDKPSNFKHYIIRPRNCAECLHRNTGNCRGGCLMSGRQK